MPKLRNETVVRAVRWEVSYTVFDAVDDVLSGAVWRAVNGAVRWAVDGAVSDAVYRAVQGAANRFVFGAVYEDPPHPGLHDFFLELGVSG